jgi:hypothetical protein
MPYTEAVMRSLCFSTFALAAALVACDRSTPAALPETGPAPRGPSLTLSLTADEATILKEAGIPILEAGEGEVGATGGVRFGADRALLAFSAVRHRDGSASGEYEYRQPTSEGELRLHGKVTCLITEAIFTGGGYASFGGPVTQAVAPAGRITPAEVGFNVADLGEGVTGKPDQAGRPGGVCKGSTTESVVEGNIQVRP